MFRRFRIAVLLVILVAVAGNLWLTQKRLASWEDTLWVAVHPIAAAEAGARVHHYIQELDGGTFDPVETFLETQAARYGRDIDRGVALKLAPVVEALPPAPPAQPSALTVGWWSLRLRYWAWRHETYDGPAQIRLFVVYHDPKEHPRLAHSFGLRKGHIGVVNAYGATDYEGRNNVVLTHELLHTLGATDKYDPATSQPIQPTGYAEPDRVPLLPQRLAELMGGRIPLTATKSRMPDSLAEAMIGPITAREIGWITNSASR